MTVLAAIHDDVARQICCASCNRQLAQLAVVPGVVVTDADGLVLERRVTADRHWAFFGPGWRPDPAGQWRHDDAAAHQHPARGASVASALRGALRQARGSPRYELCPLNGVIEAICPQCASTNTIQMEEAE